MVCEGGFYNLDVNSTCKPCPPGGLCFGGAHLTAMKNYWQMDQSFYKCDALSLCCSKVRGPFELSRDVVVLACLVSTR
jgi:hypothetical protein